VDTTLFTVMVYTKYAIQPHLYFQEKQNIGSRLFIVVDDSTIGSHNRRVQVFNRNQGGLFLKLRATGSVIT